MTKAGQRELATWTGEPVRTNRKLKDDFYLKLTVLATVVRDPAPFAELLWRQRDVNLHYLRGLGARC